MLAEKTKPAFKLRPYQAAAVDANVRLFNEPGCNPLTIIPTGGGKGPLTAVIGQEFIRTRGQRVITATHVKELVGQNYQQVRKIAPQLSTGIYSASIGRKDKSGQFTVANVQSICNVADQFRNVGLLQIDEAHLLQHGDDGQYHQLIKGLRVHNPDLIVAGLTATPWRLNSGNLTEPYKGVEPMFNDVAFEIGIAELVSDGYLTRMIARSTSTRQNTSGVAKRGGEFIAKDLNAAVNTDTLNETITEEVLDLAKDRVSILDFCVSVDHAKRVAETYIRRGVRAGYVSGDMPGAQRDGIIAAFKAGRLRVLANCGILTTGFDHPPVDCIVHRRPTNSPGLFLQIAGRGTRVIYAPGFNLDVREERLEAIRVGGKPDCLMLDFAQNTIRHGLIDGVKGIFKSGQKEADASDDIRECPNPVCGVYNVKEALVCCECGTPLPRKGGPGVTAADREAKLSLKNTADNAMGQPLIELPVHGMRFSKHTKNGASSFKLSFNVPGEPWPISQWWAFDQRDWRQKKARQAWRQFTGGTAPPNSVDEAVARADELKYPSRIWARKRDSGFWEIEGVSFAGEKHI